MGDTGVATESEITATEEELSVEDDARTLLSEAHAALLEDPEFLKALGEVALTKGIGGVHQTSADVVRYQKGGENREVTIVPGESISMSRAKANEIKTKVKGYPYPIDEPSTRSLAVGISSGGYINFKSPEVFETSSDYPEVHLPVKSTPRAIQEGRIFVANWNANKVIESSSL